jgi:hypothetical protein
VMRNFLIETETCEAAPCQMHAQFLNELSLAADAIQIANQDNAQQQFWIDRRTTSVAIAVLSAVHERSRSPCADQSAATNASLERDLPVGSSRTAIPNGRVDPSCALVLRQWPSTTAWSNYAAKQLVLPYGPHQNRLICTEFFNTHACTHQWTSSSWPR